eukprot:scaffold108109_cov34-Prasinocladus_malaysianus.AAC.2
MGLRRLETDNAFTDSSSAWDDKAPYTRTKPAAAAKNAAGARGSLATGLLGLSQSHAPSLSTSFNVTALGKVATIDTEWNIQGIVRFILSFDSYRNWAKVLHTVWWIALGFCVYHEVVVRVGLHGDCDLKSLQEPRCEEVALQYVTMPVMIRQVSHYVKSLLRASLLLV